ncbi:DnaB-like helicase C-terminal domain-containing protein [Arthrobacter sp. Alg241-R88]|uniref:replicative DNA helicase n=1 Tax=Arthrobacter sp. Alg241-R88 TaxID=2305984 RepID=UPI0013D7CB7E|nr:DnaB-like helicase C-terminal domain-containing protein [Arthrobacter sp. Alg241-R88]
MNDEMPTANDAEVSLLGACMSGFPDIDDIDLESSDFYQRINGDIWAAIRRVHATGAQPDAVSVRLALTNPPPSFNPVRLFEMTQLVPVVARAPFYAEQVAAASGRRRLMEASVALSEIANEVGDIDEQREMARQAVDDATRGRSTSKARTIADILPSVIDTAQNGRTALLGSGWPDVDRLIGGLGPGRLVVVGARPGVGKSVMGTNLALHFAHHHEHAVLLASLEMPEDEVGQRLLAAFADANLSSLQDGTTDERTWQKIAERHAALDALPIHIDDTAGQTVTHIRKKARDVQRTRDDLALIVVDYLQLVRPADDRKSSNRAEQVGQISRDLKLLARETGACVVAMAQVNREGTKHQDGKPRMTDLRESGSIEADADQVILLHQPDDEIPEIEVLVDKNRHGPKGVANLQMQGFYARLASVSRHYGRELA